MDEFFETDWLINHEGKQISKEEFAKIGYGGGEINVYINSTYQVVKRICKNRNTDAPDMIWLSIKRRDKEPIHDWRDLQEIKNMLVGKENEGVELYPAESRRVDTSNQYHLWVVGDPRYRFPWGFNERWVSDDKEAAKHGAKQRPFKEGQC